MREKGRIWQAAAAVLCRARCTGSSAEVGYVGGTGEGSSPEGNRLNMSDLQRKYPAWAKGCSKVAILLPIGSAGASLHHAALGQANPGRVLVLELCWLRMSCLDSSSCSFSATGITAGFFYCFSQVTHELEQD